MRIAIDAMGGDQAPAKILQGALDALPLLEGDDQLILVGNQDVIRQHVGPALDAAGGNSASNTPPKSSPWTIPPSTPSGTNATPPSSAW